MHYHLMKVWKDNIHPQLVHALNQMVYSINETGSFHAVTPRMSYLIEITLFSHDRTTYTNEN